MSQLIQDHVLENMSDEQSIIVENRLWWVLGRKSIIKEHLNMIRKWGGGNSIIDIGCGSGGNLDVLANFGNVIGVEPSAALCRKAHSRGIATAIYNCDVLDVKECRNTDLFTMFDVLEHIENDIEFLSKLRLNASCNHRLLISVPAYQFLYSNHDKILHHYRRYNRSSLQFTLEESGYTLKRISYFMSFLFPFVLASRLKAKILESVLDKASGVDVGDYPSLISKPMQLSLMSEAFLSRWIKFPFGLWLFAVAEDERKSS